MSNQYNFGELSFKDDELDTQAGFSTIDLGGGVQPPVDARNNEKNDDNNNNLNTGSSYTSFGEALSTKTSPSKTSNTQKAQVNSSYQGPKRNTTTDSITSNEFVHVKSVPTIPDGNNIRNESPTSMLSTASEASAKFATKTASTLESFRLWGKSAYKCTRQIVSERLGKTSRTIDPELDVIIENLKETKKKYDTILQLSRNLSIHFANIMQTQQYITDTFSDLSQKSPELINEFKANAETQRHLIKNGEILLRSLGHFTNSLNTLCNKTMEDTFLTIRNYEAARLEYDAYRFDLETLKTSPENKYSEINSLERDVSVHKERYENLKRDVKIKIKFLDENRVKVMKKQLDSFQYATTLYFAGNHEALEKITNEYRTNNIQNDSPESFLEQN